MLGNVTERLIQFSGIESPTGKEGKACKFLFELLREHFPYDFLELQEIEPDRYNVILTRGTPRLTLTSHIDTVPGYIEVKATDEAIYGRGTCDSKGQIITQLFALDRAISHGLQNYSCFYVVGEEVDSIGAC